MRAQHFQPAFFFKYANDVQRIVFVGQLLELVTNGAVADVLDVIVLFCGIVAGLGTFLEWPVKTARKSGGTNQTRRIFYKCVIVQNAQQLGFDIGGTVEGIHQQAA